MKNNKKPVFPPEVILYQPAQWGKSEDQSSEYERQPLLSIHQGDQPWPFNTEERIDALDEAWNRLLKAYNAESQRLAGINFAMMHQHYQPAIEQVRETSMNYKIAWFQKSRITQPEPGQEMNLLEAINWLAEQYEKRQRFPKDVYAIGFKPFWRSTLAQFLQGSIVHHVADLAAVPANNTAVIWGRQSDETRSQANTQTIHLVELEDGFVRSVGLGAEFAKPLSWVADSQTLYFDASMASDLEDTINLQKLTDECIMSAKRFRLKMLELGISKYNTGNGHWQRPAIAIEQGRDVVLVTGQVERDASIKFGAPQGSSNLDLMKKARELEGNAYLIYKPHPDVVAGARAQGSDEQQAWDIADEVVTDTNITQMLPHIDRMHVLTSLAGFEGLLYDVEVVCHGMPFYAGWGLTTDIQTCSRRKATPSLDALVYAACVQYPMYISRDSGYYCSGELTLSQLANWKAQGESGKLFRKTARKLINLLRGQEK